MSKFELGKTYKWTNDRGQWFTIELNRGGPVAFVGTVQDKGTFYDRAGFSDWTPTDGTHVTIDHLSEIDESVLVRAVRTVAAWPKGTIYRHRDPFDRVEYIGEEETVYVKNWTTFITYQGETQRVMATGTDLVSASGRVLASYAKEREGN